MQIARSAVLIASVIGLLVGHAPDSALCADKDLASLLEGVKQIGRPGVPGSVCPFGKDAFAVVQDRQRNGTGSAVVVAARYGKGRAVVFGHGGYFGTKAIETADTAQLMENATYWVAGGRKTPRPRVAVRKMPAIVALLKGKGFEVTEATLSDLGAVDVLFADGHRVSKGDVAKVSAFVQQGGGLVSSGIGWGWRQLNPGKDHRTQYVANLLCAPMGLAFTDATTRGTSKLGYAAEPRPSSLTNAHRALAAFRARARKKPKLAAQELNQIGATLALAMRNIPPDDQLFLPDLRKLIETSKVNPVPTKAKPIKSGDVLARLVLTEQIREMRKLPPDKVPAHPASADFPGAVPADAPRVTQAIEIDTARPRWHSTGLYAVPGESIEVQVPAAAAGQKLKVRIGALKDRIWHKPTWQRVPEITRELGIKAPSTSAACAFGGQVYIIVPRGCKLGVVPVTVAGAVQAPYFVRGKTTLSEWRETVRKRPAPWAELATDKIVLTTQSKYIRDLDDPEALMEVWDRIADACADLATIPRERRSPERIVLDRQISAGGLHAGYPIMGHLRWSAKALVSREQLLKGSWGFFHELGHNHQNRDWTFSGTGEVTVNLFSLYIQETICGIKNCDDRRIGVEARKKRLEQFLKDRKKSPFTFLVMYVQMQEAFGWDAFKKVFAEYRALPANQRPKTDNEKRDQWLVRCSKTAGRNLGPFFEWWEVATSKAARDSIAHLPVWMPEGLPAKTG